MVYIIYCRIWKEKGDTVDWSFVSDKAGEHACRWVRVLCGHFKRNNWLYPLDGITLLHHYSDIVMGAMVSQITSLTIVYSTVYSGADQKKHQSSASLAFVREIHRWPVNSPHKWSVTRKMFPFDDVIMTRPSCVMWQMCDMGLAESHSCVKLEFSFYIADMSIYDSEKTR